MRRVDARGLRCPWPALRLARALREEDSEIEIIADDPAAAGEIKALANAQGWLCAGEGLSFVLRRALP